MWYSSSLVGRRADLRDEDLDLVRLHLVGEHLAERLPVGVGERRARSRLRGEN